MRVVPSFITEGMKDLRKSYLMSESSFKKFKQCSGMTSFTGFRLTKLKLKERKKKKEKENINPLQISVLWVYFKDIFFLSFLFPHSFSVMHIESVNVSVSYIRLAQGTHLI